MRITGTGVSKISQIPASSDQPSLTIPWDAVEQYGGWTYNTADEFTIPRSGYYYVTASFTAISPAAPQAVDTRLSLTAWGTDSARVEWFRSGNYTNAPTAYVTCSLRGITYAVRGARLSFSVETPASSAKPWTIPKNPSPPVSMFSAILLSPGGTHS
ncbi:hypothetical protein GCM10010278_57580 [Streptomyces melanogenes]|nr:hypothetical protein GCM10010278_57580 [Streptomyces melanogenes]